MNIRKIFLLLSLTTLLFATSCSDDDDDLYGNWVDSFDFSEIPRSGAISFTIDGTVYYGLGYNRTLTTGNRYFSDLYSFSGGSTWTPCDSFPAMGRENAFAFAINGKGYVGGGHYDDKEEYYFSDVWEFDPLAESGSQWTQINDFPGVGIAEATTFVINDTAYVVGGKSESDRIYNACYKYEPSSKSFIKKSVFMKEKRAGAFSFVIGNKAYIGGGYNLSYSSKFEVFDGISFNALRDIYLDDDKVDDIGHYDDPLILYRKWTVAFSIDGKGYITGGYYNGVLNDCWEYDPTTDLWTEKNKLESDIVSRYSANSFVLNDVPFIVGGYSGSSYLDTYYYFQPNIDENEND